MQKRSSKRVLQISVLPGQPTNGAGRVCIHLFVQDEKGPFVEPAVLHPAVDENGDPIKQQVISKPTRGRLACDIKRVRTVASKASRQNVTTVTMRTSEPYAVTCPNCIESVEYKRMMEILKVN